MIMTKMRMLRWTSGCTRKDEFWNDCIREKVKVASIEKKMTEVRL